MGIFCGGMERWEGYTWIGGWGRRLGCGNQEGGRGRGQRGTGDVGDVL